MAGVVTETLIGDRDERIGHGDLDQERRRSSPHIVSERLNKFAEAFTIMTILHWLAGLLGRSSVSDCRNQRSRDAAQERISARTSAPLAAKRCALERVPDHRRRFGRNIKRASADPSGLGVLHDRSLPERVPKRPTQPSTRKRRRVLYRHRTGFAPTPPHPLQALPATRMTNADPRLRSRGSPRSV